MNISKVFTLCGAFAKENAPVILEGVSITLGGLAVVSACSMQHKADEVIRELPVEDQKDFKKCAKATWKYYLLPAGLYAGSALCGISSYKTEATRMKALVSAAALSSDKTDGLIETAKEKLGIESKDGKGAKKPVDADEQKIAYMNLEQWFYDPISGFKFRTTPAEIYAACIEAAQELMSGNFVSIRDIVDGCQDIEYLDNVTSASDLYGFDCDHDNCTDLIPDLTEGYASKDGNVYIKLKFTGRPHTRKNEEQYIY